MTARRALALSAVLLGACTKQPSMAWRMPELAGGRAADRSTEDGSVAASSTPSRESPSAPSVPAQRGDLPDAVALHVDPPWLTDVEQAAAESRRTHRPMLVHFAADWCLPCHLLESDTLSDPVVRQRLSTHFVALRIDVTEETRANRHEQARYRVRGLPTMVFVDDHGRQLERIEHYLTPDAFLARLDAVLARAATGGN